MRVHTPAGAVGPPPAVLAATPAVLSGVQIGVLDNTKPNAGRLLRELAGRLAARTGATVALTETKNAALAAPDEVIGRLENNVQVVLTGSAD